ncbi:TRAP transporter substrate-binding protein [Nitrospina watsonii]|uniref:TRAP dicarboxylate transporter-DctP subunit n=1 Tax=Nitrospina watsonii TaxID=1323948 RepID=A0ABN8VZN0_9BACT|nr:TRAP transporter substrate-binding protein DctP [Nitrospina watsonii]CAI2717944.1 Putative TRAP dicarboxylate transporter-DctP subunit [Nitrospina watsonii]
MFCSDRNEDNTKRSTRRPARTRFLCIACGILASLLFALVMWTVQATPVYAASKTYIKFSTLAPEGSSWMNRMNTLSAEVDKATNGEVAFKFYPGGVSGDEIDVIRKMRIGQLHAAGFTGVGLGQILPEVRVLDLPFLFRDDKEIEHVYDSMTEYFAGQFEKEGYVLLGWVPVGWIHFFSQKPIDNIEDLHDKKAWMWEGDPLVQETYKHLGVTPFPMSITDVLLSLQTGMLDTVYASPVGALALQWFTKVRYMSELRMGNATGAVLMTTRQFKKLSESQQKAVRDISRKNLKKLVQQVQQDNDRAIEVIKKNGLKVAPMPSEAERQKFFDVGEKVRKGLAGNLFDQKLLDQVLTHLNEFRS